MNKAIERALQDAICAFLAALAENKEAVEKLAQVLREYDEDGIAYKGQARAVLAALKEDVK